MKIFLKTYGCQMNLRDAEVIAGILQQSGFGIAGSADSADVVIFVTCAVRQHAEDRVWSEIGRICKRMTMDERRKTIIGLVGCMAQEHREKAFERSPDVDFVVGPSDIGKIPEIVKKIASSQKTLFAMTQKNIDYPNKSGNDNNPLLFERKIWEVNGEIRLEEIYHTGFYHDKEHAYVVISEGCSNFCSYCVVPYVRGPLRHRDFEDVLQEVEQAVGSGRRRITLLGQNVCAYGAKDREQRKGGVSFVDLLILVNGIKGLEEFSFITSHPKDTTVELFEAMQGLDKLKKYLHLPAQSGSDRILKLMNRGYSKKYYLDLADNYRRIVSGGVLTTDIIVGFPEENEKDFEETVDLVRRVEFNAGFIFKYSPRPGTSALKFVDDVAKEEKERRHAVILDLQKKISKGKKKVLNYKFQNNMVFGRLIIGVCNLFVIWYLVLGIFTNVYALNLDKVKVAFVAGDYEGAIIEGEKVMAGAASAAKEMDELYYILGLCYMKDGNYLRSGDIFEIILREFKQSRFKNEAKLGLADTYFFKGDYERAKREYENLLHNSDAKKLQALVYQRLSECALKDGDARSANDYVETLRNNFPLNIEPKIDLSPRDSADGYSVQVGSFSNSANAGNLKQKLVGKGYGAFVEEGFSKGNKAVFRVKVGGFSSRQEASIAERKLSREGYPTKICPRKQ